MKLEHQQNVIQDCRQIVELWQEWRFHRREAYRCKREIMEICEPYGVKLRPAAGRLALMFVAMMTVVIGCASPRNTDDAAEKSRLLAPGIVVVDRALRRGEVILIWEPSPTPDVSYRVYYGRHDQPQTAFVDSPVTGAVITGLARRTRYRFTAKARLGDAESREPNPTLVYRVP